MRFDTFLRDQRGSAVRWFAYAAAAITVVAAVGAHGLAWVAESGRLPVIAFVAAERADHQGATDRRRHGGHRLDPSQRSR